MKIFTYTYPPWPQTPESAARWFWKNHVCKARWARHFGFDRYTVVDLLRGKLKGHRGDAHRAAVALGLKPNPDNATQRRAS
ncbi:MAG: DNA-binding protein [Azoarcus sp.]|nr:DNA-binding protein [Azoarcus sp.]